MAISENSTFQTRVFINSRTTENCLYSITIIFQNYVCTFI